MQAYAQPAARRDAHGQHNDADSPRPEKQTTSPRTTPAPEPAREPEPEPNPPVVGAPPWGGADGHKAGRDVYPHERKGRAGGENKREAPHARSALTERGARQARSATKREAH